MKWVGAFSRWSIWVDLGSSLGSSGETWEDGGDWAQEEGDEVDETEEARQAGSDTADVAGQGDEAALCKNVISLVPRGALRIVEGYLRPRAWMRSTMGAARDRIWLAMARACLSWSTLVPAGRVLRIEVTVVIWPWIEDSWETMSAGEETVPVDGRGRPMVGRSVVGRAGRGGKPAAEGRPSSMGSCKQR